MAHVALVSAVMRVLAQLMLSISGTTGGVEVKSGPGMPDFDFFTLGLGLAGVSLGLCAVLMIGAPLFGGEGEKAKRSWIPMVIQGLVLLGVSSFIISLLSA